VFKTRIQRKPDSRYDGIVFIYDVTNRESFESLRGYYNDLQRDFQQQVQASQRANSSTNTNTNSDTNNSNSYSDSDSNSPGWSRFERFPIVIIGNKVDLTSERAVSTEEGAALARELGCGFVEVSATQGNGNIENGFLNLIRARRVLDEEERVTKPLFNFKIKSLPFSNKRSKLGAVKKPLRDTLVEKSLTFHRRCGKVASLLPELVKDLTGEIREYIRDKKKAGITPWGVIKEVGEVIKGLAQFALLVLFWLGIWVFRIQITCVRQSKGGMDGCELHPD